MKPLPENKPTAKACPECAADVYLIVKTNSKNGSQFLGCPNFPACRHTEPIPEDIKLRLLGQKRLL